MNNALALPTVEQINLEHQLAASKANEAVQHAINCGLMLLQVKASKKHGEWLPWFRGEIDRGALIVGERQAHRYMKLASNSTRESNLIETQSIRAALELLSDKDPEQPVQQQVDLVDFERERAEAERLKTEAAQAAAQALELKQRNTDLHKTIMELAQQSDALKAELDARPEPAVIEKVVEKTVEILPDDYESLQRKAAKLGELKDDLAAANEALAKLKAEQARKVEDGIRQGLRQRQAEIDDFERRKAGLEQMIEARVKMLAEFDAERTANAEAAKALSAFALAVGALSADLMGLEIDTLLPEVSTQASRTKELLIESLGFVERLCALPVATVEKEIA